MLGYNLNNHYLGCRAWMMIDQNQGGNSKDPTNEMQKHVGLFA
jgi:hypothetical protein